MNPSETCKELVDFQLRAARVWRDRGALASDDYAKFFFYFSGFNALFFLWGRIDNVKRRDSEELNHILDKFDETKAREILGKVQSSVKYFSLREPVAKMNSRTCKNPYGSKEEGTICKSILVDNTKSARERLLSLGRMIYLVRSNLIHGSRVPVVDSEAIPNCLGPLQIILDESIRFTQESVQ